MGQKDKMEEETDSESKPQKLQTLQALSPEPRESTLNPKPLPYSPPKP